MHLTFNLPRLRVVALVCWGLGALCFIRGGALSMEAPALVALTISTTLLGIILLALGVAFWLLGTDRRAGVVFDSKGLLLNLGSSTAFIAWEDIERVGVSSYRSHLLMIGSQQQVGVALCNAVRYVQSYEERVPASPSLFARALRPLQRLLRRFHHASDRPLLARLANNRARTGFDVLIPGVFLGGSAEHVAELINSYRAVPMGDTNQIRSHRKLA
ncbi:MAG: hypothetical protein H7Z42_02120 [Roseiflexaceae bacterium]|nr:hypothetical protein [Roseiflexaceae bacterium]